MINRESRTGENITLVIYDTVDHSIGH
jgi:hypothetical protein